MCAERDFLVRVSEYIGSECNVCESRGSKCMDRCVNGVCGGCCVCGGCVCISGRVCKGCVWGRGGPNGQYSGGIHSTMRNMCVTQYVGD